MEELENILSEISDTLSKNDYHASTGICIVEDSITLNGIIKTAEKIMYEDKKKYYESLGRDVRNKIQNSTGKLI